MGTPQDYRIIAQDLRREAERPGGLARRARLVLLADQFDELAKDFELEIAARYSNRAARAGSAQT